MLVLLHFMQSRTYIRNGSIIMFHIICLAINYNYKINMKWVEIKYPGWYDKLNNKCQFLNHETISPWFLIKT